MMSGLAFFIGGVLPYFTALILLVGLAWRVAYWARAPVNLHWELFPYPETAGAQVAEITKEVVSLHSLFRHKRKIWLPSLLMHWGLYCMILWFPLALFKFPYAAYAGTAGAILGVAGSVLLLLYRLTDESLRSISSFVEYFNLLLILAVSGVGLATGFFSAASTMRDYAFSLVAFGPRVPASAGFLVSLAVIQFFCIYLPFSRLTHFVAKYFTYHKVKWGEIK